jgi:endonuclease/exonuclease/phosphatase family metal-dependent hydrolase
LKKALFLFLTVLVYQAGFIFPQGAKILTRVMTYNIRYASDVKNHGINAWEYRKDPVAKTIRFNKPDILGVQEALKIQLDDFKNLLPDYIQIGVARDDGKESGEYSALLINKNKFKVLESSTFWLSATPDKPSMGWDAACMRIVTWAKLKDIKSKKIIYAFNTHFDHMGTEARKNSAALLKKKIKEIAVNNSFVVTGDFNCKSDSEPYKILTDINNPPVLFDAEFLSENGNYGMDVSFNDFSDELEPKNKIDFIFVSSKLKVWQHAVLGEKMDGRYPSDHMPVVADVYLP